MARPSIDDIRGLGDFATVYNWNIVTIQEDDGAGANEDIEGTLTLDQTEWNQRCVSTTLPTLGDTKIAVSVRGHKVFQPGVHVYSNAIELVFVETVDSTINMFLQDWREKCWQTKTGKQAGLAHVKKNITIQRLNRQDTAIWTYKLMGCFLENYTQPGMTAEGNAFEPSVTLSYDYFKDGAGEESDVG